MQLLLAKKQKEKELEEKLIQQKYLIEEMKIIIITK